MHGRLISDRDLEAIWQACREPISFGRAVVVAVLKKVLEPVAFFDNEGKLQGRVSDEQLESLCQEALAEIRKRNAWRQI